MSDTVSETTAADSNSSELALDLRGVAKTYKGRVQALRGIDLRVRRGEVFGLLGPNGAGKSTLVKIMMTVIRPTRCEGSMLGAPVGYRPALGRVGYLPEHHRFPGYLTGRQVVDHYGRLLNVPRIERRRRTDDLLDFVHMREWADQKVAKYSKGMRQRVGLAQALVADPDLVLLDEPTDGVDPLGRREIRDMLHALKERGKTVFLNSHLLSELEMVCDRVAILVKGLVASQGRIEDLTAGQSRYEVLLGGEPTTAADRAKSALTSRLAPDPETAHSFGRLGSGESVEWRDDRLWIATTDAEAVQPILDALRGAGVSIREFAPRKPSLEDLFMQALGGSPTDSPGADRPAKPSKSAPPRGHAAEEASR
ncbi:MAG: ABC transporter ATP-binding protein [Planctomycetota bacterium]